jgi:hypothetical protein
MVTTIHNVPIPHRVYLSVRLLASLKQIADITLCDFPSAEAAEKCIEGLNRSDCLTNPTNFWCRIARNLKDFYSSEGLLFVWMKEPIG